MRREMKKENGGVAWRDGPRDGAGVGGWREEGAWVGMWGRGVRVALRGHYKAIKRERWQRGRPRANRKHKQGRNRDGDRVARRSK